MWHCIVKVDKNRYAVSGLNQTTDPYTQVIKLVDSQLRPVSTVTFKITNEEQEQITRMVMVEKTGLVERAAAGDGKRRVTLRPQGRRLLHEARYTAANACAP